MAVAPLQGKTLGSYQILEPLGRGGMAQVYRAYHPQLQRYTAVKVMRSDLVAEDEFLTRFRREAQAVAGLRHPNIVQVFDFNVQDDTYYMVMELLEGDTLKTRLNDYRVRGERMSWGEMARILLDVLDGLAYAHQEGMIHRDLKPANILLTKKGQAVLADFGIAQIIGSTRHTVSGALLGTLNYMAPEQGLEGKCDHRSDVYSVGIILYEMLTQETPFDADTPLAILMKHYNDPLPLPRQVAPDVPEAFEQVVLKALAKRPSDRYQSVEEMTQGLYKAVQEAGIELPQTISLPMSFSTPEAPSESVAVFSGTARQQISDVDFSDQATDVTLGKRLEGEIAELKEAEQVALAKMVSDQTRGSTAVGLPSTPTIPTAPTDAIDPTMRTVMVVFNAIGLIVIGNALMGILGGLSDWRTFEYGWTAEFFLFSGLLAMIMTLTRNIWLFILTGIFLSTGILMTYSALSSDWQVWTYLWAVHGLAIMTSILIPVNLAARRNNLSPLAYKWGRWLIIVSVVCFGLTLFLSLTVG